METKVNNISQFAENNYLFSVEEYVALEGSRFTKCQKHTRDMK